MRLEYLMPNPNHLMKIDRFVIIGAQPKEVLKAWRMLLLNAQQHFRHASDGVSCLLPRAATSGEICVRAVLFSFSFFRRRENENSRE
jgi:hypothetical protein